MSEEMEDGTFEASGTGLSPSEFDSVSAVEFGYADVSEMAVGEPGLDEARNDLLVAIEELGLGSRDPESAGGPRLGATCRPCPWTVTDMGVSSSGGSCGSRPSLARPCLPPRWNRSTFSMRHSAPCCWP